MMTASDGVVARLGGWATEWANPVVVKELRQGLRTRAFWVFFTLLLVANVCISLVASVVAGSAGEEAGKGTFIAFFVGLAVVAFFVIPWLAYRSMARELEEETWALLLLTGVGPRRILWGKVSSFALQGALYACVSAPFLLFSYNLDGIDLFSIGVVLLSAAALHVFLVAVAVGTASMARARPVRGLLQFLLLGGLLWATGTGIGGAFALTSSGGFSLGGDTLLAMAGVLYAMAALGGFVLELGVVRQSLPTENYAVWLRGWYVAQALGVLVFGVLATDATGLRDTTGAAALQAAHAFAFGTLVASDGDGMARSHRQRGGLWLFKPGALRGLTLVLVVLALTSVAWGVVAVLAGEADQWPALVAAPGFALLYLSLPQVVGRALPHTREQTPMMVRLAALVVVLAACSLPPLLGAALGDSDDTALNLLNPLLGMSHIAKDYGDVFIEVLVVWGVAVAAAGWAFRVLRRADAEAAR